MRLDPRSRALAVGTLVASVTLGLLSCSPEAPVSAPGARAPSAASIVEAQDRWRNNRSVTDTVRLTFRTAVRFRDLAAALEADRMPLVSLATAFASPYDVQVSFYASPPAATLDSVVRDFESTSRAFLTESIRLTKLAQDMENESRRRVSYDHLLAAHAARLKEWDNGGPTVFEVSVAGSSAQLLSATSRLETVDSAFATSRDASFASRLISPSKAKLQLLRDAAGVPALQPEGPGPADHAALKSCEFYGNCPPPPPPPTSYVSSPLADPWDDYTSYDDYVFNSHWAPTEGKIYVGEDTYSKYVWQHVMWQDPWGFRGIFVGYFSVEIESHQMDAPGRSIYGKRYYDGTGPFFDTNLPGPYLDSQFLDSPNIQNHAIGSNYPELINGYTWYYTWFRFKRYEGLPGGTFQTAAQLGELVYHGCEALGTWCTLESLETVRTLPFMCNFVGPNALFTNNLWKRWRYNGIGYKNEQCAS